MSKTTQILASFIAMGLLGLGACSLEGEGSITTRGSNDQNTTTTTGGRTTGPAGSNTSISMTGVGGGSTGGSGTTVNTTMTTGMTSTTGMSDGAPQIYRSGVRRLTQDQYKNAVRRLLKKEIQFPDTLVRDAVSDQGFRFSAAMARQVTTSDQDVTSYWRNSEDVLQGIFQNETERTNLLGCSPKNAQDPCVRDYLQGLMRQAWARQPEQAEVDRYLAVVVKGEETLDLWTGLSFATGAVLESPHFLYRVHLGEENPEEPGRWRFKSHEMAERLALFLWNDLPDEALIKAAESGELLQDVGLRAQAERMMKDPKIEQGVMDFFQEWFNIVALTYLSKDEDVFPSYSHTLGANMTKELEHYFKTRVLEEDGDFIELFTSRQVYINDELRKIYGIQEPIPEGTWEWQEIPEVWDRGGLFTTPGFLAIASRRTRTSPTDRGLFILRRILCDTSISPPPPNLPERDKLQAPKPNETVREWSERLRAEPSCGGCHTQMDTIGVMFERFNGLGQHRRIENGQEIPLNGQLLGREVSDSKELGRILKEDDRVKRCVVKQVMHYANGYLPKENRERELIDSLTTSFKTSGNRIKPLLLEFIMSDGFRETSNEAPQDN